VQINVQHLLATRQHNIILW